MNTAAFHPGSQPQPQRNASVHSVWQRWVHGELVQDVNVRRVVQRSWQRCVRAGVDAAMLHAPQQAWMLDFSQQEAAQHELLHASHAVLMQARKALAESGSIMLLTNAQGTILRSEGDVRTQGAATDLQLLPGVCWSEALCGTNAIGTALEEGQPEHIHGAEHFCAGMQRWTCAATVLRHPLDGRVAGVLDMSGLARSFSTSHLAFVLACARSIEQQWKLRLMEQRYRLLQISMPGWGQYANAGAILLDADGWCVQINDKAQQAVVQAGGASHCLSQQAPLLHADQPAPAWLLPQWIHPVMEQDRQLGNLILIPAGQQQARAVKSVVEPASAEGLIWQSDAMRQVVQQVQQLAAASTSVLLQGESGTGKELLARSLHGARSGAWIALNCGALVRDLLASELFGYAEGAFTGARKGGHVGKIEAANGGTLFLDEIAELPLDLQPQLLRVLEQGEVCRLGENVPRPVQFKLVAATHRHLWQEVQAERFRLDLYYRIAVAQLHIPPLRERLEDIELLAQRFLAEFHAQHGHPPERLDAQVLACLQDYAWPGNVRELRNVLETAVLFSEGRPLSVELLPAALQARSSGNCLSEPPSEAVVPCSLQQVQKQAIRAAVAHTQGNLTQAAHLLGIAKSTLYAKMRVHGLR